MTTEPGYEKPGVTGGVPLGNGKLLGQGRASVAPGHYPDSHRIHIHKWRGPKGYVALAQAAEVDITRGRTVANVVAKLKKQEQAWEAVVDEDEGPRVATVGRSTCTSANRPASSGGAARPHPRHRKRRISRAGWNGGCRRCSARA